MREWGFKVYILDRLQKNAMLIAEKIPESKNGEGTLERSKY
jgi:hypothetical protein